jgi:uncharacterized protein YggE
MSTPTATFPRTELRWWLVWAVLAGVIVTMIMWPIMGSVRAPTAGTPASNAPAEHTVTVSGTGREFVTPDMAQVRLGVLVQRPTVEEARTEAARAAQGVVAALREVGIPDADIQTSLLTLQPVYEYRDGATTPRIVAYEIRNGLKVTIRDLERVGRAIDGALAAGATTLDSVSLDVGDRTAAERQARDRAVRDARAKADTLVSAAGVRIEDVVSITENVSTPPWPWQGETAAGDEGTPIAPGVSEVVVTVTVVYRIQ